VYPDDIFTVFYMNGRIICSCGMLISTIYRNRHTATKLHKNRLNIAIAIECGLLKKFEKYQKQTIIIPQVKKRVPIIITF
jgi:hypothetical protein